MLITAGGGLVGALIGAGAAIGAQILDARRQARAAKEVEHKLAVEEVLVRSQAIDLRSQQAMTLAANLGSFAGMLERMIGGLTAIDLQILFDRLNDEANGLQRAASRVWLFADERTVALTNAVVFAAMEVVEAHHKPAGGRLSAYLRVAISGAHASDQQRIVELRRSLSVSRRELVIHVRQALELSPVDPFAVADKPNERTGQDARPAYDE